MQPARWKTSWKARPSALLSAIPLQRADNGKVKRVILCAGQVYYDLTAGRAERGLEEEVAIVRAEQLYPFPYAEAEAELAKYPNATEIMWAQEEPKNQGAWYQTRHRLEALAKEDQKLIYAGRPASASPAVGYGTQTCCTAETAGGRCLHIQLTAVQARLG